VENGGLARLSGAELAAVGALWKREGRTIEASFDGASMIPSIPPGMPLRILCGQEPLPGDVILFLHRGTVVVHRMIGQSKDGNWVLPRGDANPVPDLPIRREDVIGVVKSPMPAHAERRVQAAYRTIAARLVDRPWVARFIIRSMWAGHSAVSGAAGGWRRYGLAGFLARLWSRTGGRLIDLDIVLTGRFSVAGAPVALEGYRFERGGPQSRWFAPAAALLRVGLESRREQEAFVAIEASSGTLAGAAFGEGSSSPIAHNRGIGVDPRHRGRGVASALLHYQAVELERDGAREVEYHVSLTNRAARRMFAAIGARELERWIILVLLRRFRFSFRSALSKTSQASPSSRREEEAESRERPRPSL
jgi:ribosomal protein S18 acetylase RimI-like enzyme